MSSQPAPPHRILTPRLVIRAFEPAEDAPAVRDLHARAREHLMPTMWWVRGDPTGVAEKRTLLEQLRGRFDAGEDFTYSLHDRASGAPIGGTGLHPRVRRGAFEIGYWIAPEHQGRGLVSEAVRALSVVALGHLGCDLVVIRIRPDNPRSLGVPRRLGFQCDGRLRGVITHGPEAHDAYQFSLTAAELRVLPWALDTATQLELYDHTGATWRPPTGPSPR